MKTCRRCLMEKPITEFYVHAMMADGHLNFCKECTRTRVKRHRRANPEKLSKYEQMRLERPERKKQIRESSRRSAARHPERKRARSAVASAIRAGRMQRQPCRCGAKKAQAHHNDYSKPLEVEWLCFRCHREQEHGQFVTVTEPKVGGPKGKRPPKAPE